MIPELYREKPNLIEAVQITKATKIDEILSLWDGEVFVRAHVYKGVPLDVLVLAKAGGTLLLVYDHNWVVRKQDDSVMVMQDHEFRRIYQAA